jgi:cell division protease FtsH
MKVNFSAILLNENEDSYAIDNDFNFSKDSTKAIVFNLNTDEELEEFINYLTSFLNEKDGDTCVIHFFSDRTTDYFGKVIFNKSMLKASLSVKAEPEEREFAKFMAENIAQAIKDMPTDKLISGISKLMADAVGLGKSSKPVDETLSEEDQFIEKIKDYTKTDIVKPTETIVDYIADDDLLDELKEIIDFQNNSDKYAKLGIEIPKGVLFKGPPGTGKTYAARCIAGSSNSYFMVTTASALQGQYIGSGAENIRKIFTGARELIKKSKKGVMIFIDELDSFGSRNSHTGSASGEEDRTLNQLLAELSGFNPTDKIMVLAATNFVERLDEALLRSGRLGRQITIDYPTDIQRKHLVEYYFRKFKLFDTGTDIISDLVDGLSPADIKAVSNEAAILAVRNSREEVKLDDINEAINKTITKNVKRKDIKKDKYLVSAHEMGHVLAEALYLRTCPLKVTNETYGDAGGFTQTTNHLSGITKQERYTAEVKVLMAGRAAEQVICGYITNGASNDLQRANRLMEAYFKAYHFEPYDVTKLDQLVQDKIHNLYTETVKDFESHKDLLKALTQELMTKSTIYRPLLSILLSSILSKGGIL